MSPRWRADRAAAGVPALALALALGMALGAAAPLPVPPRPPGVLPAPPGPGARPSVPHATNAAILDAFAALAFDADLRSGIPARPTLARWTGPLSLYVQGDAAASRLVAADAAMLQPLVGLPFVEVTAGQPNIIVAVVDDPPATFAGPLRPLLTRAFAGDDGAVDDFLAAVANVQRCWIVPVWADPARTTIKAAVIGVDATQGHPALEHCVMAELAASLGLLGPEGSLPRSVFNPRSWAVRLSFEDRLMIRLLYSPDLAPGMSREEVAARAAPVLAALRVAVAMMRASAYLSIFDDWDFLGAALASIYEHVDEIVVVDGAYAWMAPFFADSGRDPSVSVEEVRAALAPFASKLRVVTGLWRDETAKRVAGFQACGSRHVLRIDADEVLFFDEARLRRFLASGQGVAEMEMPVYLAPGLIRARGGLRPTERQAFLFDRDVISAHEHCAYLWLVLPQAEREALPAPRPGQVHDTAVAFNAHLTQWRTPRTGITRARFYWLNYVRQARTVWWLPPLPAAADDAGFVENLTRELAAGDLTDILLGQAVALGLTDLDGFGVRPSPLGAAHERRFVAHYGHQLDALAALNGALAREARTLAAGEDYLIDLSTRAARLALGDGPEVAVAFSTEIERADATLQWQTAAPPFEHTQGVAARVAGNRVWFSLPDGPPADAFRCVLRLRVTPASGQRLLRMMAEP